MSYQYLVYKDYIPLILNRINKKDITNAIKNKGLTIFSNTQIDIYRLDNNKHIKTIRC